MKIYSKSPPERLETKKISKKPKITSFQRRNNPRVVGIISS
jgi:hypothetical protein